MRWGFNLWPCYRGTGARVTFIAGDWREDFVVTEPGQEISFEQFMVDGT